MNHMYDLLENFKYFGKTWIRKSTFSIVNFIKSNCRSSISYENLVCKMRCAVHVKYTQAIQELI